MQYALLILLYTANSVKVVLDGLLPIFTSKIEIICLKQHQGLIGNLLRQILTCYKRNFPIILA